MKCIEKIQKPVIHINKIECLTFVLGELVQQAALADPHVTDDDIFEYVRVGFRMHSLKSVPVYDEQLAICE